MSTSKGKMKWGFVALAVIFLLGLLVLPPLPQPRPRAQRIHSVNHVASVSITMPITNAPPAARTNK